MELSVVVPVYNEIRDIDTIIKAVERVNIPKEIIVVDDCSTDGTREFLRHRQGITAIFHEENQGKGASIRSGLKAAAGAVVIIQDADLEYSPDDYPKLVKPLFEKKTRVVYGSRILGKGSFLRSSYYANRFLTLLTNVLYNAHLTDMETCYKIIDVSLMRDLNLCSARFDIEPEITCKILKRKEKILEIPIIYKGRTRGKKIGIKDGIQALWALIKWKMKA